MRSGQLRQRITLQSKTAIQNTFGEEVITWVDFAEVWAAVEPNTGREFLEGRQVTAEVTTMIRIRYRSGVIPTMRVVYGSITYDVLAVLQPKENRRELNLICQEII